VEVLQGGEYQRLKIKGPTRFRRAESKYRSVSREYRPCILCKHELTSKVSCWRLRPLACWLRTWPQNLRAFNPRSQEPDRALICCF
jgi:hypothetical protein